MTPAHRSKGAQAGREPGEQARGSSPARGQAHGLRLPQPPRVLLLDRRITLAHAHSGRATLLATPMEAWAARVPTRGAPGRLVGFSRENSAEESSYAHACDDLAH
jgi:hypothetical protein